MKPLYKYSVETAKHDGELDAWRESRSENIRCRNYLDEQVREKFDGFRLPDECAENAIKEFGYDRTMWVIANTILMRKGDGRFSQQNQKWAQSLNIAQDRHNYEFALESHSCTVDGLASDVQKMYAKLGLFSGEHIVQTDEPQDYAGKILILKDTSLKEEYRTPENQLFLAKSGFGCSPTASGRKIMGEFLNDGEKAQFYRQDFIGVAADECLPEWARERLAELTAEQEQTQNDSPKMGM